MIPWACFEKINKHYKDFFHLMNSWFKEFMRLKICTYKKTTETSSNLGPCIAVCCETLFCWVHPTLQNRVLSHHNSHFYNGSSEQAGKFVTHLKQHLIGTSAYLILWLFSSLWACFGNMHKKNKDWFILFLSWLKEAMWQKYVSTNHRDIIKTGILFSYVPRPYFAAVCSQTLFCCICPTQQYRDLSHQNSHFYIRSSEQAWSLSLLKNNIW